MGRAPCHLMHVWLELIFRELFFLALLGCLGAGPATFLPQRFDGTASVALSPVFGLCVGACVAVTFAYWLPAHLASWLLVVLVLASLAVALWRTGIRPVRPRIESVLQLSVVVVVVLISFNYPLAMRHTVGPDGGYQIADTAGYVSETNGIARQSIRQAARAKPPFGDLALAYWDGYARLNQQLDVSALEAGANDLLGLGSTDTHSPFLIVVILVGALGTYAVVRMVSRQATWSAVLAGCLYAGPLFVELFMDGSQGAICGCAVLPVAVVFGAEALRRRERAMLVLFALLIAGLQTLYPLFLPPLVLAACVAIAIVALRRARRGRLARHEAAIAAGQLLGVVVLAIAFTPVAFARNARYWISVLDGSFSFAGLPAYRLPLNILPGWVLQTREFYNLPDLRTATLGHLVLGAGVPLLLIGLIFLAVMRHRTVLVMLTVGATASLLAYYTWSSRSCEYCVQRNLIPVAALAPAAIGLGIAALVALRPRPGLLVAAAASLLVVVVIGREGIIERQRLANGSYLLDQQNRQALSALPSHVGPVEIEGFGQGPLPPMELPMVYNLVDQKTRGDVSIPTLTDDGRGLLYLGGVQPLGPSFKPGYGYVLTRLGGVSTDRRVLARSGPIALEQRARNLDVTVVGGVSVATVRADPSGTAWVNPARRLQFLVVGRAPGTRVWVSVVMWTTVPAHVAKQPGVFVVRRPGVLRVCAHALGRAPIWRAGFQVSYAPQPAPVPAEPYSDPLPPRGVRLVSMAASAVPCSGGP